MEVNTAKPQCTVATNVPLFTFTSITIIALVFLLLIYCFFFTRTPPIVAILALLLFNDIAQLVCKLPAYVSDLANTVCLVTIVGTTFFRLASYYWLIFVTRLLYRQKVTPGKFVVLNKYIVKYVIIAYIPSIAISVVILIAAIKDQAQSQKECCRGLSQKTTMSSIMYLSSFVLPQFIALVMILGFMVNYFRYSAKHSNSLFLSFPLLGVLFIGYQMVLRMMIFFGKWQISDLLEFPFLFQPFCHGVIYAVVIVNLYRGGKLNVSEMTIISVQRKEDTFLISSSQQV